MTELDLPRETGRHPVIVGLHPASDGSRDHFLFRHLGRVLPPRGIAVARFDRRGDDVPLDIQVDDALGVVGEIERRPDIDPARIGLFGFSQGAWVAPLAASRSPKIAFLVLVASIGVTPAEQMRYATVKHARMAGFGEDAARRIVEAREVVDDYRRGRTGAHAAQAAIDAIRDEPFFAHARLPADLARANPPWPDLDFEPEPVFARVHVPVLLFYGEDDEWQSVDASVAAWRRAADRAGNGDVTVVRLAGTGHAPTLGGGAALEAVAPEYERVLIGWLARVTRSAP